MRERQDNRPSVRAWFSLAALTVIGAVALALVTRQWGFLWNSWPIVGLWLILGGIRYAAQVREHATERANHEQPRM